MRWYDDSKATTPHAAATAIAGFESVVLIAGGRNKGLDLADSRRVGGIDPGGGGDRRGGARGGGGLRRRSPGARAGSMDEAVRAAVAWPRRGDVVLLSPGCASFDWYGSYGERGDDFARAVRELTGASEGQRGTA